MLYDTQNYGGSGLCPLSEIKKLEHDVSEIEYFLRPVKGGIRILLLLPLERANRNHWIH
jgi:hypothetical protein